MIDRVIKCYLVAFLVLCGCCVCIAASAVETGDDQETLLLAPFSGEYPVGLEMGMEEFEKQSTAIALSAAEWTRETVPGTLEEFPIRIAPIVDVFNRINTASSTLMVKENLYLWETSLAELFSKNIPDKIEINLDCDDGKRSYYLPPVQEKDELFMFKLPDELNASEVKGVSYDCFWYPLNEWYVILQIRYNMTDGVLIDQPYVCIFYSGEDYSFSFGTDFSGEYMEDLFEIYIGKVYGSEVRPVRVLTYSMKDGNINNMADDDQLIEFNE